MNEVKTIGELSCTIIEPLAEPKGAVVLCHGFGAPGTDLVPIAEELTSAFPEFADLIFVFPQAPIELDPVFDSRAWWMIDVQKIQALMDSGEFRELRDSRPIELATRRLQINQIIENVIGTNELTPENVIVGGFSQGAMVATDVVLNYPQQLGGLIVWSGTLLNESEWTKAAEQKKPLSVVQSHGKFDPILPFAGAEFLREMLLANGHEVEFVPFSGEHTIATKAMSAAVDLMRTIL